MGKVGPSQEQIDSVISILSIGNFQEALEKTAILRQQYPDESLLSNISGACYQGLGQFENAIEYYEKAIIIHPSYCKAHYNLGGALQALGKLNESVESFKRALSIKPDYADAHNNIGNVFKELGQFDNAIKSFRRAIEIKPDYLEAHFNLGSIFQDLNNMEAAITSYEEVLIIKPDFAVLHNNLGVILQGIGELDSALEHLEDAVRIMPDFSEAYNNLGNVLKELNQLDRAIKCFNKAVAINPNFDKAYNNIGNVFKELGQFDNAIKNYEMAISIQPNYSEAHNNLGSLFKLLGRRDDAASSYQKSLIIKPDEAEVHNKLAITFMELGEINQSIKSYQKALSINPGYGEAHNNLGIALNLADQPEEAIKSYKKALSIKSDYAEPYFNLGNLMLERGQWDKALLNYEHALNLKPGIKLLFGNLFNTKMQLCIWDDFSNDLVELITKINNNESPIDPFTLSFLIDDAQIQLKNSKAHVKATLSTLVKEKYPKGNSLSKIDRDKKHKKIRIGYFSADFREHPVSDLSAEIYELHDRSQFEIYAFSLGPDTLDEMNLRIKAGVDNFYDVSMMSHKDVAMLSRSLEIDIAINLGGFTANSRAEIFAMSLAPVQVGYLGFTGSMGADFMDYIIADRIVIPKDKKIHYSEKIVYLPNCYMANRTKMAVSKKTLTRKDADLPSDSFVFCCFNNYCKINPIVFSSWMTILSKVNGSILWLPEGNNIAMNNLKKEAERHGINDERLFFAPRLTLKEDHLNRLQLADLFIDTFPFNAHTTCSDALRVGLPVLTCIGDSFTSRVASSLLNGVDLPEMIANSQEHYESLAIELATGSEKLKVIKDKLEKNILTSSLYDAQLITKQLEAAYLDIYNTSQKGLDFNHIYV